MLNEAHHMSAIGVKAGMAVPVALLWLLQSGAIDTTLTGELGKLGLLGAVVAWGIWFYQNRMYPDNIAHRDKQEAADAEREKALGLVIAGKDALIRDLVNSNIDLANRVAAQKASP